VNFPPSQTRAVPLSQVVMQAFHIGNIRAHVSMVETCYAAKQQRVQQEKGLRDIVQALKQTQTEKKR